MKQFRLLMCCLMIMTLILPFAGCSEKTEQVDWDLHGAWISETGNAGEKISVSFSGKIPTKVCEDCPLHVTKVQIEFPEDFPYQEYSDEEVSAYLLEDDNNEPYIVSYGFSYSGTGKKDTMKALTIFPEMELIVFEWGDRQGTYFVESTDPNADLAELFESALSSGVNFGVLER